MFKTFMSGAVRGLLIAIVLMVPIVFGWIKKHRSNKKQEKYKQEMRKTVELEAEKMMQLWGSSLDSATHEDKAMYLAFYYVLKRHKEYDGKGYLYSKYVCAELLIASCAIMNELSESDQEAKVITVLKEYFDIEDVSLSIVPDRLQFYHRVYQENGENSIINEVLLLLPYALHNRILADFDEYSPIMLTDIEEKAAMDAEGTETMQAIIGLIRSELEPQSEK